MRLLLIFSPILSTLMFGGVCCVFSEAPTTPKILFSSSQDGNWEVYMMNPDGSEQLNLTQHPDGDREAVWSPTGEQILFTSDRRRKHVWDLYLMDADGSNVRRVFKEKVEGWRNAPAWSPDGKRFAYNYTDRDHGKYGFYLGTFGKEDVEPLPYGTSAAWSPDGSEIACIVPHQFGSRLTFINVDTLDREQPLPDKVLLWQSNPSWSAAGDRLAIRGNKHPLPIILDRDLHDAWMDKDTIFIVNPDGTGLRQLVEEAGPEALWPALSPDGSQVLYTQEINGHTQIFKLDIDTGVRTQLTHGGIFVAANYDGDWFDPAYALPVSPQPELLTTTWGELKKE